MIGLLMEANKINSQTKKNEEENKNDPIYLQTVAFFCVIVIKIVLCVFVCISGVSSLSPKRNAIIFSFDHER